MANFFNFKGAKITETRAITGGESSGGNMTRLRCGGLSVDQIQNFSSKEEWSIAILTEWGILPSLFYVKPKLQGNNNQNSVKKKKLEILSPGKIPDICPNFNNELSIFQVIDHYCKEWQINKNPEETPSIVNEFSADLIFMIDSYSNRGLILIYDPQKQNQLNSLNFNSNVRNNSLLASASFHLAKISTYDNAKVFIDRWHDYLVKSTEENDIVQKRDDLERLGIQCYFKRIGVDSPACKIILEGENGPIEFNIDIELKHDSKSFFVKTEASNIVKYPRLPMIIVSNVDSYVPTNEIQQYIHPIISLLDFISYFKNNPLNYLAIIEKNVDGGNKVKLAFTPKSNFERVLQRRLALAGSIIDDMKDDPSLGRIKLAKILYIADTYCDLRLEGDYYREKFGPLDPKWFYRNYSIEKLGLKYNYFNTIELMQDTQNESTDESRTRYQPSHNIQETKDIFQKIFQDKVEEIGRIVDIFKRLNTSRAEIVATLFACWNDRIIKNPKVEPTDKEIVFDFLNNWHEEKKKYTEIQLFAALGWMRQVNLKPRGKGSQTIEKPKLDIPSW